IDNVLVDQYLDQLKVSVDAKDVDAQLEKVKAEIKNSGKDIQQLYQSLLITEAELRAQILAMARWDKFLQQYTTDKNLRDFFDGNKALFDGSQMRAKHILVQVKAGDAQAAEQAKARIALLKKQVTDKVAQGLAGAGQLDNLELNKKKRELLEAAFAEVAAKDSDCPSKANGGELGWFPRSGGRVAEPFAKAAFALKPLEMSDA